MRKLKCEKFLRVYTSFARRYSSYVRTWIDRFGIRQDGGSFKLIQQDGVTEAKGPGGEQCATILVRRAESAALKDDNVIVPVVVACFLRKDASRTAIAARNDGIVEGGETERHLLMSLADLIVFSSS